MSLSRRSRFQLLPPQERRAYRQRYGEAAWRRIVTSWHWTARPEQLPPKGDDWFTWLIRTGRGFGKTRTASEWVAAEVESGRHAKAMFMGKDIVDARQLMFEQGLLEGPYYYRPKRERPTYKRDGSMIVWPNGAWAKLFGAEDIEQARGWQYSLGWLDEFAIFRHAERIWKEVVLYTIRLDGPLGDPPRLCITTTPKRKKIMREIAADKRTRLTTGSTYDNRENLAERFIEVVSEQDGTTLGRQEIYGDQLDEVEGALWRQDLLDRQRLRALPPGVEIVKVVVGVDPPSTSTGAEAGITAGALDRDGHVYLVADHSRQGSPGVWGRAAVELAVACGASELVIEVNQGGDMAEAVLLRAIEDYNATPGNLRCSLRVEKVHAAQGKTARAGPVHQLYELGRAWHVGVFAALEEQQTTYTGKPGEDSPDRLDSWVWTVTHLAPPRTLPHLHERNEGWARLARAMGGFR